MRFAHLLVLTFSLTSLTFAQTGFKLQSYPVSNDRHLIAQDLTRDGAPDLVMFGGAGLYVRINGSQINTKASLAAGQHRLVVVEAESSGSYLRSSAIYFNVQ